MGIKISGRQAFLSHMVPEKGFTRAGKIQNMREDK